MKKIKLLSVILTAVMLVSTFSLCAFATDTKLGDVNADNDITIVDAKWVLQAVAGVKNFTPEQKAAADVNGDSDITIIDAKWILQAVAGMRNLENSAKMYTLFSGGIPDFGAFFGIEKTGEAYYDENYDESTADNYAYVDYSYSSVDLFAKGGSIEDYYKLLKDNNFIVCTKNEYEDGSSSYEAYNPDTYEIIDLYYDAQEDYIAISLQQRYMCSYDDFGAPNIGKLFGISYNCWYSDDYSTQYSYEFDELKKNGYDIDDVKDYLDSHSFSFYETSFGEDESGRYGYIIFRNYETNAIIYIIFNDEYSIFVVNVYYTFTYEDAGVPDFEEITGIYCGSINFYPMGVEYGYNAETITDAMLKKYANKLVKAGFSYSADDSYEEIYDGVLYKRDCYYNYDLGLQVSISYNGNIEMYYISIDLLYDTAI